MSPPLIKSLKVGYSKTLYLSANFLYSDASNFAMIVPSSFNVFAILLYSGSNFWHLSF